MAANSGAAWSGGARVEKGTFCEIQVPWGKLTVLHYWLTFAAIPKPLAETSPPADAQLATNARAVIVVSVG